MAEAYYSGRISPRYTVVDRGLDPGYLSPRYAVDDRGLDPGYLSPRYAVDDRGLDPGYLSPRYAVDDRGQGQEWQLHDIIQELERDSMRPPVRGDKEGSLGLHLDRTTIIGIAPECPAQLSGQLRPGDRILEIDGFQVSTENIRRMVSGPAGTRAMLTIMRHEDAYQARPSTVDVVRIASDKLIAGHQLYDKLASLLRMVGEDTDGFTLTNVVTSPRSPRGPTQYGPSGAMDAEVEMMFRHGLKEARNLLRTLLRAVFREDMDQDQILIQERHRIRSLTNRLKEILSRRPQSQPYEEKKDDKEEENEKEEFLAQLTAQKELATTQEEQRHMVQTIQELDKRANDLNLQMQDKDKVLMEQEEVLEEERRRADQHRAKALQFQSELEQLRNELQQQKKEHELQQQKKEQGGEALEQELHQARLALVSSEQRAQVTEERLAKAEQLSSGLAEEVGMLKERLRQMSQDHAAALAAIAAQNEDSPKHKITEDPSPKMRAAPPPPKPATLKAQTPPPVPADDRRSPSMSGRMSPMLSNQANDLGQRLGDEWVKVSEELSKVRELIDKSKLNQDGNEVGSPNSGARPGVPALPLHKLQQEAPSPQRASPPAPSTFNDDDALSDYPPYQPPPVNAEPPQISPATPDESDLVQGLPRLKTPRSPEEPDLQKKKAPSSAAPPVRASAPRFSPPTTPGAPAPASSPRNNSAPPTPSSPRPLVTLGSPRTFYPVVASPRQYSPPPMPGPIVTGPGTPVPGSIRYGQPVTTTIPTYPGQLQSGSLPPMAPPLQTGSYSFAAQPPSPYSSISQPIPPRPFSGSSPPISPNVPFGASPGPQQPAFNFSPASSPRYAFPPMNGSSPRRTSGSFITMPPGFVPHLPVGYVPPGSAHSSISAPKANIL